MTVSGLTMIKDSPPHPHPRQPDPEEAVLGLYSGTLLNSLKDGQLLAQGEVFKSQTTSVFKG
jgi:hypothetical protein